MEVPMSRLSEISFEPLEPYDGKLSCTVLRGERGSNAPDLPDITDKPFPVIQSLDRKEVYMEETTKVKIYGTPDYIIIT
jgi:hypothetical protein